MSEALEEPSIRAFSNALRSISLSGLLLTLLATQAGGEGLHDYGARMCADAGIPLEDCTLVSEPSAASARNAESGGGKAATLVEHGRRVCEQENVPLEDCQALPSAYRSSQASPVPVPIPPSALPPVDQALVAVAPPPQAARRVLRTPRPPAPLPVRPAGAVATGDPGVRYLRPPPPPAYRFAPGTVAAPGAAVATALPIEPDARFFQPPPPLPAEPDFRFVEEPAPFVERGDIVVFERERPERLFREERLLREDRFGREERFRGEERTGRCLRAVRFPGPGSSRHITC